MNIFSDSDVKVRGLGLLTADFVKSADRLCIS